MDNDRFDSVVAREANHIITSPELKQAHLLKEDFRRIFEVEDDKEKASRALEEWTSGQPN